MTGPRGAPSRRLALSALAAGTLALAGCARPVPRPPPQTTLPPAFAADAPAGEIATDWRSVYPEPALRSLIERVLAGNRDLQLAAARVVEARATLAAAEIVWLPQVSAQGGPSRQRLSEVAGTLPRGFPPYRTSMNAQLNASLEVDLWGRIGALVGAAQADAAQLEANRRAVELGAVATAASAWFGLVALDDEQRIVEGTLAAQQAFADLTRRRRDGGAASGLEVAQAQAALEQTRAQAIDVARRRALALNALAALAGGTAIDVDRSAPPAVAADAPPAAGLPSSLLARRPDLIAAERALAAADLRVQSARAALYPSITLTGSLGSTSQQLGDLFTGPARTWSLGLNLLQPLIDAQRNRLLVDAAVARSEQALLQYHRSVEQAFREVRDALDAKRAAVESAAVRERQVAELERAEAASLARYRGGLVSYFEVIDAQRALLAARLAASQARLASRQASVELFRAVGGGWAPGG